MRRVAGGPIVKTLAMTVVGLALVTGSGHLAAQGIHTEFTNLEVLPQDITRQEIVSLMRSYVGAVGGGRCSYCHLVSDALDEPSEDFASDEKAAKRNARVMMEMVSRINSTTLPSLPDRRSPNVEVTCSTCHAGLIRPEAIADVMSTVLEDVGVDAAVE